MEDQILEDRRTPPHYVGKGLESTHFSELQAQLIPQDMAAIDPVDGGLALPTSAVRLAAQLRPALADSPGQFVTEIEVAADAFFIGTIEEEQGLRVREVVGTLDLAARLLGSRSDVRKDRTQGL